MPAIKFAFIGGTYRGFRVLEALIASDHIPTACFVLQEDPHEIMRHSPDIMALAERHHIPGKLTRRLNHADYGRLRGGGLDLAVVCGWRTIISPDILPSFRLGLVAAHDSLLPKYRGFAPLNWAIINGEKTTGVTLFRINAGEVDSGEILAQTAVPIGPDDYAIDVYNKVTTVTVDLYLKLFSDIAKSKVRLRRQDDRRATYTCKRSPEDGRIRWDRPCREVYALIRGLAHPYPGAFCNFRGETFHVRQARLGPNHRKRYAGSIPGRVIGTGPSGIEVLCGSGTIQISQWESKAVGIVENPAKRVKRITDTLR